jgi:hypothetical protein
MAAISGGHVPYLIRYYRGSYPYLSVDTQKYRLLQSMGFGRARPRAIFWVIYVLYYVLNDYILSKYNNYEVQ